MLIRSRITLVFLAIATTFSAMAQTDTRSAQHYDPIDYSAVQRQLDRASRPTFGQRLSDILTQPLSQSERLSLTGRLGVAYTQETNLAITAAATAAYPSKSANPNDVQLSAMVSVNGFFNIRAIGNNYFGTESRHHLQYQISGGTLPIRFWGLGYEAADNNPRTKYTRHDVNGSLRYYFDFGGGLRVGAGADFDFGKAAEFTPEAEIYLAASGQTRRSLYTTAIGLGADLDRRDNPYTSTSGYRIALYGEVRPKALGNFHKTLWHWTIQADYFLSLWRGGVLALDLYGDMWSHSTPWLLWPSAGGDSRMRGYYYGRYTDRKMITAQAELRQTIYGPIGISIWGGAGSLFDRWSNFDASQILPNGGVGLRLASGNRTTLRIDYGFGRHSSGVIINVNEAF